MKFNFVFFISILTIFSTSGKPQTGCDSQGCYSVNEKGETAKCGPGGCFLAKSHNNQFVAPGDFTSGRGVAACGPGGCFNTNKNVGMVGCGPQGCTAVLKSVEEQQDYVLVPVPKKDAACGPGGCFIANNNGDDVESIEKQATIVKLKEDLHPKPCSGFGCAIGNADCGPHGCSSGSAKCGPAGCHAPGK